ncbi:MAG TPA: sigma-70 family RNA polymerase sigma factor [Firmicutes bacterium]|nr:sigma-70 family RNA polymerase sigma factor [Candidatus Fermentithermobacillaceae bacterium]
MALLDEVALVRRAAKGDMEAFETLVRRYEKGLYNLAFRLVSNPEDAMDVVQEVFLKTYQALPEFRGESKFSTWVYRVCVNASLDLLRKKQKFQMYSLDEPLALKDAEVSREVEDSGKRTEDIVETRFLGEAVLRVLKDLEPHYRALLVLCDVQGYSYQEISEILGMSLGTVKSRLHRARNLVRKILAGEQFSPSCVKGDEGREHR